MTNSLGDVSVSIKLEVTEEPPSSIKVVNNNQHHEVNLKNRTANANYCQDVTPLVKNEVVHREGEVFVTKQELGSDHELPELEMLCVESPPKRTRRSTRNTVEPKLLPERKSTTKSEEEYEEQQTDSDINFPFENKQSHSNEQKRFCEICNLGLSRKTNYNLHMRHHTNDRRFQCPMCPKAFVRSSDMKTHMLIHTGEKPYTCDVCNKCFRAKPNLISHKKLHRGEASKNFKCEYCEKKFLSNRECTTHMRSHTGEKPFICKFCSRGFSSKFNLNGHMERDHVLIVDGERKVGPTTEEIREQLPNQERIIEKLNKMTKRLGDEDVPIQFEITEEPPSSGSIDVVINKHHEVNIKEEAPEANNYQDEPPIPPLVINEVVHQEGEVFITEQELGSNHEQTELEVLRVESPRKRSRQSSRNTFEPKSLPKRKSSNKTKRGGESEEQQTDSDINSSVEHKRSHSSKQKRFCEICNVGLSTNTNFNLHMRHHANDRRFKCPMCPKAFVRSWDMKTHVRIHTGEKPYICDLCNKCFRAKPNLISHKKVHHLGEASKKFKCEYCEKRFLRNRECKIHMRSHTGEKPFKCNYCKRAFASKFNLNYHMERDHQIVDGESSVRLTTKEMREQLSKQEKLIEKLLQSNMTNTLGDEDVPTELEVTKEPPSSSIAVINNNNHEVNIKEEAPDVPPPLVKNEVVHREGEVLITEQKLGSDHEQPNLEVLCVESPPKRTRRSTRKTVEPKSLPELKSSNKTKSKEESEEQQTDSDIKSLAEHKHRHSNKQKLVCEICNLGISTKTQYNLHMRHHTNDRRFQCPMCPKDFVRSSDMKTHMRVHTGEKPYVCDVCNKCFRAQPNLIAHKKLHLGEALNGFKCEYCEKKFLRNRDCKIHMRSHTGEKPFKCKICKRAFSIKFNLKVHMKRHNVTVDGKNKVRLTAKELVKQDNIIEKQLQSNMTNSFGAVHVPKHEEPPNSSIEVVTTNNHHEVHIKEEAPDANYFHDVPPPLVINEVVHQESKVSITEQELGSDHEQPELEVLRVESTPKRQRRGTRNTVEPKSLPKRKSTNKTKSEEESEEQQIDSDTNSSAEHKQRNSNKKKLVCEICNLGLSTKTDYNVHMRRHTNDRRFQCPKCPKAFIRSSDIKMHMRVHTGEKPFACDVCNKYFRAKTNLTSHKKLHMGEASKIFKCEYCDKKFLRNGECKIHMRTHTGEKPFKCKLCERAYTSLFNLKGHMEKCHQIVDGENKVRLTATEMREELAKQEKIIAELKSKLSQKLKNDDNAVVTNNSTSESNKLNLEVEQDDMSVALKDPTSQQQNEWFIISEIKGSIDLPKSNPDANIHQESSYN